MCGILSVYGLHPGADWATADKDRRKVLQLSKLLRHRGPDQNSIATYPEAGVMMAHERLIVVDPTDKGRQPFHIDHPEGNVAFLCNGEIYNHDDIRETDLKGVRITKDSDSDCAVIGHMYIENGRDFQKMVERLDGMFAISLFDEESGEFWAARDEMGKAPMYWGQDKEGAVWVASEMKAIQGVCEGHLQIFPPGHIMRATRDGKVEFKRWFNEQWITDEDYIPEEEPDLQKIHDLLVKGVVKRLMCDVPFGILLSGGLDSSLVAAIAVKHLKEAKKSFKMDKLKTFSIGLEGAPDLLAARKVAEFLGTDHHEFHFTVEEGVDALRDLVWNIESYEQVRAATPMYLLSRKIKALGVKMVLSGEGADEIYGGYLYFHKAPDAAEFHRECVRKTSRLHQWDVLRANKAPFAFGVEPRTPFLDKDFMNYSMNINPEWKMCNADEKPDGKNPKLEKYLLRKAFDTPEDPYLPQEVLWRQKEQFSDGVGYNWVDGLKEFTQKKVTDEMWEARFERFPKYTPRTREYYYLRSLFEEQFPSDDALETVPQGLSVACSTPEAVSWDPTWKDMHEISGRAIAGVHASADGFKSMDSDGEESRTAPVSAAGDN